MILSYADDCMHCMLFLHCVSRLYVQRVLLEIGLANYCAAEKLFAVTDVLPHCKPDKALLLQSKHDLIIGFGFV